MSKWLQAWRQHRPLINKILWATVGVVVLVPILQGTVDYARSWFGDGDSGLPLPNGQIWTQLQQLDFKTGRASADLLKLDGTVVQIPGFAVPLDYDSTNDLKEFLLTPSPLSCIHVPTPPPNQVVHVKMTAGQRVNLSMSPVLVEGTLKVIQRPVADEDGTASFELTGIKVSEIASP